MQMLSTYLKESELISDSARSRVWRIPGGLVYKQLMPGNLQEAYRENLRCWLGHLDAAELPEVIAPEKLIYDRDVLCGYVMQFCPGVCLEEFLMDREVCYRAKLQALLLTAEFLCRLPSACAVGDLHEENILVQYDGKNYQRLQVRLIDCDSFTFRDGPQLNCPAKPFLRQPEMQGLQKYNDDFGHIQISRQTDILCFFRMLLRWITNDTWEPFFAEFQDWMDCAAYLEREKFPAACMKMFRTLFTEEENYLSLAALHELAHWNPHAAFRIER